MTEAVQVAFVQVGQVNVRPFVGVQVERVAFVYQNLDAHFFQLVKERLSFVAVGVIEEREDFAFVQSPGAAALFEQFLESLGPVFLLPVA
ncbi:MAG: hypothetical protein Kow00106_04420 [Anaerolineae bacterium]